MYGVADVPFKRLSMRSLSASVKVELAFWIAAGVCRSLDTAPRSLHGSFLTQSDCR